MVRRCTYPSIHFFVSRSRSVVDCAHIQAFTLLLTKTLSRSRSTSTYPSIRTPWSTRETRGLWARPPVLTPVPVPSQATHSRACLNLHHCDIQSTAQKSPCVNTFLRPSSKKKTETFLLLSGSHTEQRQRTRETPHTEQRTRETTESTM